MNSKLDIMNPTQPSLFSFVNEPKAQLKSSYLGEIVATYQKRDDINEVIISSSRTAVDFLRTVYPVQINYREAMVALYLNRRNQVLGYATISIGGVTGTVADPKLIIQNALLTNACGLILCHNHPSGNLSPSKADLNLTSKLKKGAEFLDIQILDHLILTETDYYSFADNGDL